MATTAIKSAFSTALILCAWAQGWGAAPIGYYDGLDGKKKEALKAAAKAAVTQHQRLNYTNLPVYWEYSDVYPELVESQSGDMCKRWWEMYSNNIYLILPNQTARQSFSANGMQREHSVPKSWWKYLNDVEYTPAYTDMWNLYPSDGPANQAKLNYPLGEVGSSVTYDNGSCKVGTAVTGQGGGSGRVFEPADEYKGDFARSFFYMATVYDDLPWVVNYMYVQESWPTLQNWAVNMLLQWARQDPVSQKEIDRNDAVENAQGNRNPFVDFPELAEFIWGTRTDEVFNVEEQGGQVTPPITGDPELTSPANGSYVDLGQAVVGMATSGAVRIEGANLTGSLSVSLSGKDKSMFTVSTKSIPASSINMGTGYLLEVVYTPASLGMHEASLLLFDGGLSGSLRINLRGEGCERPVLSTLTAYEATDVTDSSYVAHWSESPEPVDYYTVTRVRYYEEGAESETYDSPVNSLEFTDRDPEVMESYTVVSSRLGIHSQPSNSIIVNSGSSVTGIMAEMPFMAGEIEGGFVVIADSEHTNMSIYDLSGRLMLCEPVVRGGDTFMLPRGIYLITTDQSRRPVKLIVR
jgi:endonuclease I